MANIYTRLDLIVASIFINILGLAVPLYVIQAFSRYLANGFDETLYALTFGVLVALGFEYLFKRHRLRSLVIYNQKSDGSERFFDLSKQINFSNPLILDVKNLAAKFSEIRDRELITSMRTQILCLDFPFSILYFVLIYVLSPIAAFIFLIIAILAALLGAFGSVSQSRLTADLKIKRDNFTSSGSDIINKHNTIWLYQKYESVFASWKNSERDYRKSQNSHAARLISAQNINATLLLVTISLTVFTSAIEVFNGNLDLSALIAINILIGRAFNPIASMSEVISYLRPRRRMSELLEMSGKAPAGSGKRAPDKFIGKIELKGLSQFYPGMRAPLFKSLNLSFHPGSTTVITGSNGSGKTTLFNLLTGLIKPSEGSILVDDLNLEQIKPDWWRNQLLAVGQEPEFLEDTLRANLLNTVEQATHQEMTNALSMAGLISFIDQSKDGLDTVIGTSRARFNLGFRKRLALARASLINGMLVIMDEPTEGLDSEGARIFYNFLNDRIKQNRTVVILSHDPAIIKGANTVIDLDKLQKNLE